jgi:hypothetical protein
MKGVDISKILASLTPLLLAAMWWVISSVNDIHQDITEIRGNMMMLIDPNGQIIPSPDNAIARQELKEDIVTRIHDLQVRLKLLEAKGGN